MLLQFLRRQELLIASVAGLEVLLAAEEEVVLELHPRREGFPAIFAALGFFTNFFLRPLLALEFGFAFRVSFVFLLGSVQRRHLDHRGKFLRNYSFIERKKAEFS